MIVGLDPRLERLPQACLDSDIQPGDLPAVASAFEKFCIQVIDVVAPLVPGVKPNAAFFEALGPAGMEALARVNRHARDQGLLVILDAKRGDIGSTAEAYANAFLAANNVWAADALTVNPFLGCDSLEPFVQVAEENQTGIFVLVKTSNPGSADFQDLTQDGKTVSDRVAEYLQQKNLQQTAALDSDCRFGSLGAVVGATHPEQIETLRQAMPNAIFLIPGVGAQGGKASDIAAAFNDQGLGAIVNSSRGIIFAYENEKYSAASNWQAAVEQATHKTISDLAEHTSAGVLLKT